MEWQPIETAPKDGTEILACSVTAHTGAMLVRFVALIDFLNEDEIGQYIVDGMAPSAVEEPDWFFADFVHGDRVSEDCRPTHWMPLPEPPEAT